MKPDEVVDSIHEAIKLSSQANNDIFNKSKEECPDCDGDGFIERGSGKDMDRTDCGGCDGTGKITVATRKSPRTPDSKIRY